MKVTHIKKAKLSPLSTRIYRTCLPAALVLAAFSTASVRAQSVWSDLSGGWSSAGNWTPQGVPVSGFSTQLVFNATFDYTTTNDIGGTFNLNRITVNNTGTGTVTINGASNTNTFTFGGADPTLDITGTVLFTGLFANDTSGGTNTITKTGPGTFVHDSNNGGFTGTLIVNQGTFINRSDALATTNFNPVSIVVNNGGTYQFGRATAGNPNLPNSTYITANSGGTVNWQEGEDFGGLHLHGGTLNFTQGGTNCVGTTPQDWTSGTFTGGNFGIAGTAPINKTTPGTVFLTGDVFINNRAADPATGRPQDDNVINIIDGTISMANAANLGAVRPVRVSLGDVGGATAGTLDYLGVTATRAGTFITNAGGGIINVDNATSTLTLSGGLAGVGNLSKTGAGKLYLSSALGTTGTITVNAGTLQVEPVAASGNFAVAANSVFIVNSASGTISLTTPGINLMAATATLQFDLNTNGLPTVPLMVVSSGGITFTGTPTLKLTNAEAFANGTYTVVDYDGAPISSGLNLSLPGRTLGTLVYDTINTKIDVNISGNDTVKWAGGANGDWDVGTAAGVGGTSNWKLATAGTATNFIHTDSITFDDTATRFDVNLTTTVLPFLTQVNAAANYTISGPGKLSGTMSLNKSGTGTFSLATDNDYSGGTNVTQGAVQLGNGGTTGSVIGTITLSNGGALAFNRSDDYSFTNTVVVNGMGSILQNGSGLVTFANVFPVGSNEVTFGGPGNFDMAATVSGDGIINKTGTGTLTLLANNNAFTGTLNINAGTVQLRDLGAGGDLSAKSIVVNNSGTFIFGPDGNADLADTATKVTVNTGGLFRFELGENYGGLILDGGEFRIVRNGRNVNSNAVAASEGATVYDLRSGSITTDESSGSAGLNQAGNTTTPFGVLTKTTNGTVNISGAISIQGTLALQIREGTLAVGVGNFPSAGTATITMGDALTNGTLRVNGLGSPSTSRPIGLEAGGGTFHVADPGTSVTLFGAVSGSGSFTKTGDGTLMLGFGNDYTGDTVVAAGALEAINFFGSATGSGAVSVSISGTLSGDGSIVTNADKDVLINGILQPGLTGAQSGTDLSITVGTGGSIVLGPSSVARFDLWNSAGVDQSANPAAADLLAVTGDFEITAGAVLKLTNPNSLTFLEGDVFRLFDWTGRSALTGTWIIDSTDLNLVDLTVDTSDLYTQGKISIVAVPEPSSALLAVLGITICGLRRRRNGRSS